MTADHTYFEVLCALAASRQLTLDEAAALREHFEECLSCREKIGQLTQTGSQLFFIHASQSQRQRMPKGMTERFVARGIREGVPLSRPSPRVQGERWHIVAIIALVLVFMAVTREHSRLFSSSVSTSSAPLAGQRASAGTEEQANPLPAKKIGERTPIHFRKTSNRTQRNQVPGRELFADAPAYLNRHFSLEPNQARAFFRGYTFDGGVGSPNAGATSSAIPWTTIMFHSTLPISGAHALRLLASCEPCVFNPGTIETNAAFAWPMERSTFNIFDTDSQRLKGERQFPLDLTTFQPAKNLPR